MTGEALAAPPEYPVISTRSDLGESMARNLEEDLQRLLRVRGYPKDKREFQRITIRSVKRYIDTVRAWVRESETRLIADEDRKFNEDTAPQREAHEAALVQARTEYEQAVKRAHEAHLESTRERRVARDSAIREIRNDVAKRLAEADRIERDTIREFKDRIAKEFQEGFREGRRQRREGAKP